ncbi:methionine ABC transporter ATP-binding protein [Pseudomonas sp. 10S4]|uniref:methionine ABC transporter ATP-binding protein n=1 Tax=Pseudomonas sp. 10S4 TaxID=3048583 RepID=UPI002AC8C1E4|nr:MULTISPECIES: methionine ABC transporter ATP-binding protein [unclassified Pseudomonas]MEB0228537.1 methionine ABC transporter ATP-binding protein [Pseudomonas sp. 5S1]MEB0298697.1 methionine ABC transporter ATP-binding protein [Pseudomonas sp. 10S4]WPX16804.1 methionine ABC transporter ATP-binding protein [Pseudomonas sp. 10S4]
MIVVEQLSKTYAPGQAPALDQVSLSIPDGAIYGILGRSGAGKSTLLRCLNLLERPSAGRILLDGEDLTALSDIELRRQRQRIGMIFQGFNLLHSRNVFDNIAVPLEIARVRKTQRHARVRELLDLVGLSDKAQAFPSQLSGGQKQRVGIARALAARPAYLLSDEATSALDPQTTASILELLRDINRQLGLTIVLITHELEVVKSICDHAASLAHGRLVEAGSIAQLLANPDSSLGRSLLPGYSTPLGNDALDLSFFDNLLATPVLNELKQQGVELNLLASGVESVGGRQVGRLRVAFRQPGDELKLNQVVAFLKQRGVRVERS